METTRGFVQPPDEADEPEVVAELPPALEGDPDGGGRSDWHGSAATQHALYWWDTQEF